MNYTEEQVEKYFDQLPDEVQDNLFSPEIEHKVQKVGVAIGLLIDQQKKLNALVNFVLLGLLSEKEFSMRCQELFSLDEKDAAELVQIFSREIFGPIGEIKTSAIEKQARVERENKELFGEETIFEQLDISSKNVPAVPNPEEFPIDLSPANLPVAEETEPLLPPIPEKIAGAPGEIPVHPFEEKMARVFTASTPQMGEIVINTPASPVDDKNETPGTTSPIPVHRIDPYREPIE